MWKKRDRVGSGVEINFNSSCNKCRNCSVNVTTDWHRSFVRHSRFGFYRSWSWCYESSFIFGIRVRTTLYIRCLFGSWSYFLVPSTGSLDIMDLTLSRYEVTFWSRRNFQFAILKICSVQLGGFGLIYFSYGCFKVSWDYFFYSFHFLRAVILKRKQRNLWIEWILQWNVFAVLATKGQQKTDTNYKIKPVCILS